MKARITMSMPTALITRLKALADREGRSLSNLVRRLLEEALELRSKRGFGVIEIIIVINVIGLVIVLADLASR